MNASETMNLGILTLPLLPVRSEPSERSEMTTQLLFGETFELLEERPGWTFVRNLSDGYVGWATSKMLTELTDEMRDFLRRFPSVITCAPLTLCRKVHSRDTEMVYPAGSRFYLSDEISQTYFFFTRSAEGYDLHDFKPVQPNALILPKDHKPLPERILRTAARFLNAPYLWGGKTIFGMDCSGLTQVSASVHGFQLPRDAGDQASLGSEIALEEAAEGDLAFFTNPEGRIVHVGIVAGKNQILHASGSVRFDTLDEQGIFNREMNVHTHSLHSIKRIIIS
jgi:gamma-D-glutamyl-L-lysine dipeptidyl-peptidase